MNKNEINLTREKHILFIPGECWSKSNGEKQDGILMVLDLRSHRGIADVIVQLQNGVLTLQEILKTITEKKP